MGEARLNSQRWEATPVFWHVVALLLIMLFALWLRPVPFQPDPALQGYLQIVRAVLAGSSVLFFQIPAELQLQIHWAPVALWVGRTLLALLLVSALLVEHFLPRSRHPKAEIAGALLSVLALTYLITLALRRLPAEVSPHPLALIPSPQQLLPGAIFLIAL